MSNAQQMRGYIDPRTGEYKRTTEEADEQQVHEDLAFIAAWRFYWDGPLGKDKTPMFEREAWLNDIERGAWLENLTEEQRQMLADCPPLEEVPALEASS
jgi:hypothetical protein